MAKQKEGYVYILTNRAMPGLVKIGYTRKNPIARAADLYTTGVPLPFKVYAKLRVKSPKRVETKLHRRFEKNRLNPNREFFQVQPRVAHAALYEAAGRRGQSRRWVIDVMWVILLVGVAVTVWQVT